MFWRAAVALQDSLCRTQLVRLQFERSEAGLLFPVDPNAKSFTNTRLSSVAADRSQSLTAGEIDVRRHWRAGYLRHKLG
jgi:hypothetical protein